MHRAKFTFIDLFAGIGGMRIAFERSGGKCVFSSEWDLFSQITYQANHGEQPAGDIKLIASEDIPVHDVLVAGFPCQPFSIAGISKRNSLGVPHGFLDKAQGTCFFEIARIIKAKRPRAFLLENVMNLVTHDKGRTYEAIKTILVSDLKYCIFPRIIDARWYVPQHRERIYIVGFESNQYHGLNFKFRRHPAQRIKLPTILECQVSPKYTLSDRLWKSLKRHRARHRRRGNGFGYRLVAAEGDPVTRTLSARYHKDGAEILIRQQGQNPRRLTPRECARLMGFEDRFQIPVSDTQAYRQFGNSVVIPVVTDIAAEIACVLETGHNSPFATLDSEEALLHH